MPKQQGGHLWKRRAWEVNVSDKAISRWEREESMPDITLIPVLADIFEVTCDDLLRGEKPCKMRLYSLQLFFT